MLWVETRDHRFVNTASGVALRPYHTGEGSYEVVVEVPGSRAAELKHLRSGTLAEVHEKIGRLILASGDSIAAEELLEGEGEPEPVVVAEDGVLLAA